MLKIGLVYQGYRVGITAEEAKMRFIAKYGYEPETVERSGPNWLVGPLRDSLPDAQTVDQKDERNDN